MSDEIIARERQIAEVMGWTHLDGAHKVNGWDMLAPDGSRIAIRFDELSLETGAHFLEMEQRPDRDSRWVASGFGLARKNADWWVMANSENVYVAPIKALWSCVKRSRGKDEKHSRRNFENPEKRLFARGEIVPLETLSACCIMISDAPK